MGRHASAKRVRRTETWLLQLATHLDLKAKGGYAARWTEPPRGPRAQAPDRLLRWPFRNGLALLRERGWQ